MIRKLSIRTPGAGLHEITEEVSAVVAEARLEEGICHMFLQHTSASLLIQENADPTARRDLELWLNRLVPESDFVFTHTTEGFDDMPSHIKSALTSVSLAVPIVDGELSLGTWQGIFIWEHRTRPHTRTVIVHVAA